jgi:hypothetical protein
LAAASGLMNRMTHDQATERAPAALPGSSGMEMFNIQQEKQNRHDHVLSRPRVTGYLREF